MAKSLVIVESPAKAKTIKWNWQRVTSFVEVEHWIHP